MGERLLSDACMLCNILLTMNQLWIGWTEPPFARRAGRRHLLTFCFKDTQKIFIYKALKCITITLSASTLPLMNSIFQNCSACSKDRPIPLRKRPYCIRPPWRRWWFSLRDWWSCLIHNGNDFPESCKQVIVNDQLEEMYYIIYIFLQLSILHLWSTKDIN